MPYESDDWSYDDYQANDPSQYEPTDDYYWEGNYGDDTPAQDQTGGYVDTYMPSDDPYYYEGDYGNDGGWVDLGGGFMWNSDTGEVNVYAGEDSVYNPSEGVFEFDNGLQYNPANDTIYDSNTGDSWWSQHDGTYKNINTGDVYDPNTGLVYAADDWDNRNSFDANPTKVILPYTPFDPAGNIGTPPKTGGAGNSGTPSGSSGGGGTVASGGPKADTTSGDLAKTILDNLGKYFTAAATAQRTQAVANATRPTTITPGAVTAGSGMTGMTGAKKLSDTLGAAAKAASSKTGIMVAVGLIGLLVLTRRKRQTTNS